MTLPKIEDYSILKNFISTEVFIEKRMDYDGSNNMIYIGYSRIANASTSAPVWFIAKLAYNGSNKQTRYQLPNNGVNFGYAWDDRTTSFA